MLPILPGSIATGLRSGHPPTLTPWMVLCARWPAGKRAAQGAGLALRWPWCPHGDAAARGNGSASRAKSDRACRVWAPRCAGGRCRSRRRCRRHSSQWL